MSALDVCAWRNQVLKTSGPRRVICLYSGWCPWEDLQPRISNISHRKGLDDEEAVLMGASVLELPMDESCAFLTLV